MSVVFEYNGKKYDASKIAIVGVQGILIEVDASSIVETNKHIDPKIDKLYVVKNGEQYHLLSGEMKKDQHGCVLPKQKVYMMSKHVLAKAEHQVNQVGAYEQQEAQPYSNYGRTSYGYRNDRDRQYSDQRPRNNYGPRR